MSILFEFIKLLFFLITIALAMLHVLASQFVVNSQWYYLIHITMPGYLVICGLMIGYLLSIGLYTKENTDKVHVWGYIGGLSLGIIIALFYMFV